MQPLTAELQVQIAAQRGLVSRSQLHEHGFIARQVELRMNMGFWQPVTSEVIMTRSVEITRLDQIWAAALHFRGFALTGVAVLELHGLGPDKSGRIDVIGPRGGRERPLDNCVVHTSRKPIPLAEAMPPQVVSSLAVVHAMALARSGRQAALYATFAVGQKLCTLEELRQAIANNPRSRLHRRALAGLSMTVDGAESMPERDFAVLCAKHRLPKPRRQVQRYDTHGRSRYTDVEFWINGYVLAVEVDGVGHLDPAVSADDRRKANSLALQNVMVFRVSSFELKHDPIPFMNDLKSAIAELRGRPRGPHLDSGT